MCLADDTFTRYVELGFAEESEQGIGNGVRVFVAQPMPGFQDDLCVEVAQHAAPNLLERRARALVFFYQQRRRLVGPTLTSHSAAGKEASAKYRGFSSHRIGSSASSISDSGTPASSNQRHHMHPKCAVSSLPPTCKRLESVRVSQNVRTVTSTTLAYVRLLVYALHGLRLPSPHGIASLTVF